MTTAMMNPLRREVANDHTPAIVQARRNTVLEAMGVGHERGGSHGLELGR